MEVTEERNGHNTSNGITKPSSPATSNGYQNGDSHPNEEDRENTDNVEEMGKFLSFKLNNYY